MKKIVIPLLVVGVLIGAFFALRQPAPVTASPGDFLPRPDEGSATILLQARDMSALGETLAEKSELLMDLLPSAERFQLETFALKMREVAPHFGESLWLASLQPEEEVPELTASFAVRAEDPQVFLEELFDRVVEKIPGYTMEKLEADLPEPAVPLMRIQDPQSGFTFYTALFPSEESPVLLVSTSREGLRAMMGAYADPQERFVLDREVEGAVFLGFVFPPDVLEEMGILLGEDAEPTVPLMVQVAFDGDEKSLSGQIFSNAYDVMATPEEREAQRPLGGDIPFVGEGTLIGFSSGRVSGLTEEAFKAELEGTPDAEDVLEALESMEKVTGLTLGDLVDLLNGRVSLVLGGGALTPVGEVPGVYMILEPDRAGVAARVAHAVLDVLPLPVKPEKTSLPGWSEVYGIDVMATFTLAVDEHRLLAGLLDAGQMNKQPVFPASLEGILSSEHYGVLGLSFVELEKAVDGLARRLGLLLHDPRISQGLEAFHRLIGPLDTLTIEATSPERGSFRLTYREQPTDEQEVQ